MELTSQEVNRLMGECLFKDGEPTDDAVVVEGIVSTFGLNPQRVTERAEQISDLLAELPEEFQAAKGGGWTFLNACEDCHGRQWTGEHSVMENLFVLGIAAGKAKWLLPRDMWSEPPGGMPYVAITETPI
jgi:hypothetical protein